MTAETLFFPTLQKAAGIRQIRLFSVFVLTDAGSCSVLSYPASSAESIVSISSIDLPE